MIKISEVLTEFRIPAGEQKVVYQFKGFTASQMDELHAMLHRAGIVTTPDFNKRTITTYSNRDAMKLKKNKTIQRFIKSKGGKQIKESKYTVHFDVGSAGLMSKTVDAKTPEEAEKKVASGLHGKYKIKKVVKEGTCGYGLNGKLGEEPAGPNLRKKIKDISKDKNESKNKSLGEKDLMKYLMKRFKFSKKKSIDTMKKAGFDTSMLDERLKKGQKIIAVNPKDKTLKGKDGVIYDVGIGNSTSYMVQVGKGNKTRFAIMTDKEIKLKESVFDLDEACQKGYMTHPTRKTKIMFGKRYRNCVKKEGVDTRVTEEQAGMIADNICVNCGDFANENLRKWFKDRWVNIGKKKKGGGHPPCGTSGKKRGYAKCVPASKAARMTKKQKASATRRKRAAQNKAGRGGKQSAGQGKKPIYVSTKPKK